MLKSLALKSSDRKYKNNFSLAACSKFPKSPTFPPLFFLLYDQNLKINVTTFGILHEIFILQFLKQICSTAQEV